jgi:hypothetical protein
MIRWTDKTADYRVVSINILFSEGQGERDVHGLVAAMLEDNPEGRCPSYPHNHMQIHFEDPAHKVPDQHLVLTEYENQEWKVNQEWTDRQNNQAALKHLMSALMGDEQGTVPAGLEGLQAALKQITPQLPTNPQDEAGNGLYL